MKLPLLVSGYDPSRTVTHDPTMAKEHVFLRKTGAIRQALCGNCGNTVEGYVRNRAVPGTPVCSLRCARLIARRS